MALGPVGTSTYASALSGAMTFKIQAGLLKNLRANLVFADESLAEQGTFSPGFDTIMFVSSPDIALNVTPLTEGLRPDSKALTIATVTFSTDQYGDLVSVTDIAKVKSPVELVQIGTERLARQARESLDQIARDVIAAGGTPFYSTVSANTVRTDLATTDIATANGLKKLAVAMFKAKIPRFADGFYRMMVHPDVSFDIRAESSATVGSWMDAYKYTDNMPLLRGEIGRFAGFRFQEVVNCPTFVSTANPVYANLAYGDVKGWGVGDLQTLQTYHVMPGGDHYDALGQEELLGWKVNWGCGVLKNSYFYRFETASTVSV
jgi:N4-gp56 family major capsid protein